MNFYPAILTDSLFTAQEQLDIANSHPAVETVQFDIIDGFYADNLTISPLDIAGLQHGTLNCDLHFMTNEPLDFVFETVEVKEFVPVRALIAQVERMSFQNEYLQEVKRHGWKAGLSLDLYTPLEAIDEESWSQLDIVQIMGIEAGAQGRPFHVEALQKVKELTTYLKNQSLELEVIVDGGVELDNLQQILAAGAASVAAGSSLWQTPQPLQTIDTFLSLAAE